MAEKPDPKDFMLSQLNGQQIMRKPGEIRGYDFVIDNLTNCNVYLLDHSAQITIDDCSQCNFWFGPVNGSVFFRDCENCTVSVSCSQFRMKSCTNFDVFCYAASDPSIEYSKGLRFAPLRLSYPDQDVHFRNAKLDNGSDFWSQVFDFNQVEGESHWSLLPPDEFNVSAVPIEGMAEPVCPVDRHVSYGGQLTDDIIVGSQQQTQLGGMQSFGFDTTQEQAEASQDQLHPMREAMMGSDPFGSDEQPAVAVDSQDPFGEQPPAMSSDPFAAPSDPFAASEPPMMMGEAQDPFGSQDPPAMAQPSAFDADPEEVERQRLRDEEHQARMQAQYQRDEEERRLKDERRNDATTALSDWLTNRNKAIETNKNYNREQEKVFAEQRKKGSNQSSWQRVVEMIDFKAETEAKDRARLRAVLMAKKAEG